MIVRISAEGVLASVDWSSGLICRLGELLMSVEHRRDPMEYMEDADLARAAASGQDTAFEMLIRRHYRTVLNVAWRYTRNREDALDVAQETFLAAHRAIGQFRDSGYAPGFRAWVLRITANKALDLLRRKKRLAEVSFEDHVQEDLPQTAQQPEQYASRNEFLAAVRRCVDRLSPELRITLMLREFEGLSYEEIAEVTGVPKGTVMSRLFNARRKIQEWLREMGFAPPDPH